MLCLIQRDPFALCGGRPRRRLARPRRSLLRRPQREGHFGRDARLPLQSMSRSVRGALRQVLGLCAARTMGRRRRDPPIAE